MKYLNLVRWPNLVFIVIIQYTAYALLKSFSDSGTLETGRFWAIVFVTLIVASAGYVINDLKDIKADTVNRPGKIVIGKDISKKAVWILFWVLSLLGFTFALLSIRIMGQILYLQLFLIISGLLYGYSVSLKRLPVIGNLTIAVISGFAIFLIVLYDWNAIGVYSDGTWLQTIIKCFIAFAVLMTFYREIVKDIEDLDGDKVAGYKTLPVIFGRQHSRIVAAAVGFGILIYSGTWLWIHHLKLPTTLILAMILLIILPLIYSLIVLWKAETQTDFHRLSTIIKLQMLTGVLVFYFFRFAV